MICRSKLMAADYAAQIKELIPMNRAVELYVGETPNAAHFIRCPFHTEKTASCHVDNTHFHCFGCGAHGDVVDLVTMLYKVDFKSAIKQLNDDFVLGLPIGEKPTMRQLVDLQAKRVKRERERKQAAEAAKKRQEEYDKLYSEWLRLSWAYDYLKPASPETVDPRYVEACNKLELVQYTLRNMGTV